MTCAELEPRILEYLENQLSPAERALVQDHLLACANCRAFAQQLQQLDGTLATVLTPPALSAGFLESLHERIRAQNALPSEQERAERKRQLQAEFEAALAQLKVGSFGLGRLLDATAGALTIGLLALLVCRLTPALTHLLPQWPGVPWTLLVAAVIAGATFLLVGMQAAFPRQFRVLLEG